MVELILEGKGEDVYIDLCDVMLSAMDGGHLNVMDLCIRYGFEDIDFVIRNATSMKVIRHLVDNHGGKVKYVEYALVIALNGGNMIFAKEIVDYAREKNVILGWKDVADRYLDRDDMRSAIFCLTYAGDHLGGCIRGRIENLLSSRRFRS